MLTLGAVGLYIRLSSRGFTGEKVALRMRKFVGRYMRVHEKYACGTVNTRGTTTHGLGTLVGSVCGKLGPHTRPSCYVYCLHRAQNGQNLHLRINYALHLN